MTSVSNAGGIVGNAAVAAVDGIGVRGQGNGFVVVTVKVVVVVDSMGHAVAAAVASIAH